MEPEIQEKGVVFRGRVFRKGGFYAAELIGVSCALWASRYLRARSVAVMAWVEMPYHVSFSAASIASMLRSN